MATSTLKNARFAGISSAVPEPSISAVETGVQMGISAEQATEIAKSTGVERRHIAPPGMCTSDMCFAAAERLLTDLGWARESVDALVFVSQTPDYVLPATSCVLHERLRLSKSCAALDINLGCSGYLYGLWVGTHFVAANSAKRVLVLAGETASWCAAPEDRAVMFLFGDAGTATALEFDEQAPPVYFRFGTDGSGHRHIMIPGGGYRMRASAETLTRKVCEDGVARNDHESRMNGPEVFAFTLREVPPLIKGIMQAAGWSMDDLDGFVPHQANLFMLDYLAKRMRIPPGKVVLTLKEFGNTSSASVPLAMCESLRSRLRAGSMNLLLSGFGVGWSWGAAAVKCGPMVVSDLVVLPVSNLAGTATGI